MRQCEVCERQGKDRRTADHIRHLHELEPGTPFKFPVTDLVSKLLRLDPSRAEIKELRDPEEATFEGKTVIFEKEQATTRFCSSTAQVEPLEEIIYETNLEDQTTPDYVDLWNVYDKHEKTKVAGPFNKKRDALNAVDKETSNYIDSGMYMAGNYIIARKDVAEDNGFTEE